MDLGQFSISLSVKNLRASKDFYENLGFTASGDVMECNYLIMKQGDTLIDLFHGMFKHNILTFNPGWNSSAENVDPLDDVRDLQAQLEQRGINVDLQKVVPNGIGPAHFLFHDLDGNVIMIE